MKPVDVRETMWLQLIGEEATTESVIPSGRQTRKRDASALAYGREKVTEPESPQGGIERLGGTCRAKGIP